MIIRKFQFSKLLLLTSLLFYGFNYSSGTESGLNADTIEVFLQAQPQTAKDRTIKAELQSIKTVNLSEEHQLYRSGLFAATDQILTVYDYQKVSAYQFDYDLNLVRNFGRQGQGPGEFINPTDFITDSSKNFLFVDARTSRITKWSEEGELIEEVSIPFGLVPHRYAYLNELQSALFTLTGQFSIHILNREGQIEKSALSVTDLDFSRKGLLLDGNITADDERIYYTGRRNNLIKAYSNDGELIYSRNTINPIERDLLNMSDDELRETPSSALDIEIFNNYLFILNGGADDDPNRWRYLDVYDKSDGEYIHTFLLEYFARKVTVQHNDNGVTLAVLGYYENSEDRALSLYKFPKSAIE